MSDNSRDRDREGGRQSGRSSARLRRELRDRPNDALARQAVGAAEIDRQVQSDVSSSDVEITDSGAVGVRDDVLAGSVEETQRSESERRNREQREQRRERQTAVNVRSSNEQRWREINALLATGAVSGVPASAVDMPDGFNLSRDDSRSQTTETNPETDQPQETETETADISPGNDRQLSPPGTVLRDMPDFAQDNVEEPRGAEQQREATASSTTETIETEGRTSLRTEGDRTDAEAEAVENLTDNLDNAGIDANPASDDITVQDTDNGVQIETTTEFEQDIAAENINEETAADLNPGEDIEFDRSGGRVEAELTASGRRKEILAQARETGELELNSGETVEIENPKQQLKFDDDGNVEEINQPEGVIDDIKTGIGNTVDNIAQTDIPGTGIDIGKTTLPARTATAVTVGAATTAEQKITKEGRTGAAFSAAGDAVDAGVDTVSDAPGVEFTAGKVRGTGEFVAEKSDDAATTASEEFSEFITDDAALAGTAFGPVSGPSVSTGDTTENLIEGAGTGVAETTLGAPRDLVKLTATGKDIAAEGIETARETGSLTATNVLAYQAAAEKAEETITETGRAAEQNPAKTIGLATGGAVGLGKQSLVTGRLLGKTAERIGQSRVRDRIRTAGADDIDAENMASQEVLDGEVEFPGADDRNLYSTEPDVAVRQQARENTPDAVAERFEEAGIDVTSGDAAALKKALDVEPSGPGRGRAAQGFESTPDETGLDSDDITQSQTRNKNEGEFTFENPGSFASPEVSPHFLREMADDSREFSMRPGLPEMGGAPTITVIGTRVQRPDADSQLGFAREMADREGETTAFTKPANSEQLNLGEIEAVNPPGSEFVDIGSGTGRNTLRRVGVGADAAVELEGRRVPVRMVAPESELRGSDSDLVDDVQDAFNPRSDTELTDIDGFEFDTRISRSSRSDPGSPPVERPSPPVSSTSSPSSTSPSSRAAPSSRSSNLFSSESGSSAFSDTSGTSSVSSQSEFSLSSGSSSASSGSSAFSGSSFGGSSGGSGSSGGTGGSGSGTGSGGSGGGSGSGAGAGVGVTAAGTGGAGIIGGGSSTSRFRDRSDDDEYEREIFTSLSEDAEAWESPLSDAEEVRSDINDDLDELDDFGGGGN